MLLRFGISHQLLKHYKDAQNVYENGLKLLNSAEDQLNSLIGRNKGQILDQLGRVAAANCPCSSATQYGLEAAGIFFEYQDQYSLEVVLRALARLRRETGDGQIPRRLAELLGVAVEEVEGLLAPFTAGGAES